jgi:hypothetical protein
MEETDYINKYVMAFGDLNTPEGIYPKDSRLAKAYEIALDIRRFEIDNYWKRSSSFWLVVAAIFTALGVFTGLSKGSSYISAELRSVVCLILSMAGSAICFTWYLINESSKFWQRNWEYQVDILERKVLGPLYKTVFAKAGAKMYSVTDINKFVSLYVCILFVMACLYYLLIDNNVCAFFVKILIFLSNICFCVWVEYKTSNNGKQTTIFEKIVVRVARKVLNMKVVVERESPVPSGAPSEVQIRAPGNDEMSSLYITAEATVRYLTLLQPPRTAGKELCSFDKLWAPPTFAQTPLRKSNRVRTGTLCLQTYTVRLRRRSCSRKN